MSLGSSIQAGFGLMGGMAVWGLIALLGIVLIILSRRESDESSKKSLMFWSGIVLVVIGGLPYLPIFGLDLALDQLTN